MARFWETSEVTVQVAQQLDGQPSQKGLCARWVQLMITQLRARNLVLTQMLGKDQGLKVVQPPKDSVHVGFSELAEKSPELLILQMGRLRTREGQ